MCTRNQKGAANPSQVMLYLKLRNDGCNKKEARHFCKKHFCMIDQTKESLGPKNHRVLKLLPNMNLGNQGWQPGFLMKYDLGDRYKNSKDFTEEVTKAEKAILLKYDEFEKKKSSGLLQKMLAMKNYASTISNSDQLQSITDPLKRIRKISQELQANQSKPKKYFEHADMHFYELVDQIPSSIRSGSMIDLPSIKFDNLIPDGFNAKLKYRKTKFITPQKPSKVSHVITDLEDEAKLIMALQTSPGLQDCLETTASKRKQTDENLINLLKKQNQKLQLADEFNQTQYLFTPSRSNTRLPSQIDTQNNEQIQSFVQKFYANQSTFKFTTQQVSSSRTKQSHMKMKTSI